MDAKKSTVQASYNSDFNIYQINSKCLNASTCPNSSSLVDPSVQRPKCLKGLNQVKKCIKIFNFWFSVILLT